MDKPNIVLIMADQFRGDCIGYMGHPDVKTPYLDTLAAQGVAFRNAYTACPSCIPARAALYTGMGQRSHGRVGYRDGVRWDYRQTMAGELAKAGYYTQCVGKMHVHPLRNLCGFHNIELHDGYLGYYRRPGMPYSESQLVADDYFFSLKKEMGIEADVTDTGLECNSWVARPWIYEEKYHPTNWVTSKSIDFLRRRDKDNPFFLMASYVRPHPPFDAPQCYFDMYRDKQLTPPVAGSWAEDCTNGIKGRIYNSDSGPRDPHLVREMQAGYYACITHLDHQIGRLIQALNEHKVQDNTIILFVSDHGELLGDHHTFRKSRPYQGSIHIPLIISGPNRLIGQWGRVRDELVELRDIMPTALDIAAQDIPEAVEGRSLMPFIKGQESEWREFLHGEHSASELSNHFIVTETDKFIWHSQTGREQYFRLLDDPHETHDLIGKSEHKVRIDHLRAILIKELDGREEGYSDGFKLHVGRSPVDCLKILSIQ